MPLNKDDPVRIAESDSVWADEFERLAGALRAGLGSIRIEHIGSTAVPGLPAKPIIDLVIVYRTSRERTGIRAALETLGYRSEGEKGISGREAFKRTSAHTPSTGEGRWMDHHLYLAEQGSEHLGSQLAFRDFLREDPEAASRYGRLKRALARELGTDREAYTDGKNHFVGSVLRSATGQAGIAPLPRVPGIRDQVSYEDFAKLDVRAGIVLEARPLDNARHPALVIEIDFGPLGVLKSSAQITDRYRPADLLGKQVVAVVNFPPKQVGSVMSRCLVLGAETGAGITLLTTDHVVARGERIF